MEDLVNALKLSSSPDVADVKKGEECLSVLSERPEYLLNLVSAFGDQQAFIIRWMAAVSLKNAVDRFWRRNYTEEERGRLTEEQNAIKESLLSGVLLKELDPKIRMPVAVTISKIARFDCPDKWTDLLPTLIRNVELGLQDDSSPNNAMLFLYHVTKVLSQKKLPADRAAFRNLAAEAFPIFKQLCAVNYEKYVGVYSCLIQSPSNNNSDLKERISNDLQLNFKLIKKLLVNGFSKVRELPQVTEFIQLCLSEYLPSTLRISLLHKVTQKVPECLCKLFYEFVYNDPMSFATYVGPTIKLLIQVLFVEIDNIGLLSERFVLKAVNLFKIILLSEEFQPKETLLHLEHPLTVEARQNIDEIMNHDTLTSCVRICIEHYLIMDAHQVESWNEDPETYFIDLDTGGESWQTNKSAAVGSFFVTLIKQKTELTNQVVLDVYSSVIGSNSGNMPQDLKTLLAYDAVLYAFGLALYDVSSQVTLGEDVFMVLERLIYAETEIDEMKIVRRRVCYFLYQWIDVGFPATLLDRLSKLLIYEFNNEKDAVVLLTATKTLHTLVDFIDMLPESITTHTPFFISTLHSLIDKLEQCDSKGKVLATLTLVIDRTRFDIAPFANDIIALLQNLWNTSAAASFQFLRSAVLDCLGFIVSGMKQNCDMLFSFVKYVEGVCLDQENEQSINLMQDGLNLLLCFVQNTQNELNEELLTMLPAVLPSLELGSEYVQLALPIVSSYAVLFKTKLYPFCGDQVNASLLSLYRDTSRDLMILLVQTIKVYFQVSLPNDQSCLSSQSFFELTRTLLQEILDQDCSSLVQSDLIALFSRLILEKSQLFVGILTAYAHESQTTLPSVLSRLIGIICDCIDDIVDVRTRKLTALALIFTMNPDNTSLELVKERFAEVFYVCLGCLHDLVDPVTGAPDMLLIQSPKVIMQDEEQLSESMENAHDIRERSLNEGCITSSVSLKEELRNLLTLLRNSSGINYDELMSSIDDSCKIELEKFYQ